MSNSRGSLFPEAVLEFWFGADSADPLRNAELWFRKDAQFDAEIRRAFQSHLEQVARGGYSHWRKIPREALAFIILLDQFSRNIYRDSALAFAQDALALRSCLDGLDQGFDGQLRPMEASFFYMPLMHSEELTMQRKSVNKFEELLARGTMALKETLAKNLESAVDHCKIIEKYGRFPHRNALLGRPNTASEDKYLTQAGEGF